MQTKPGSSSNGGQCSLKTVWNSAKSAETFLPTKAAAEDPYFADDDVFEVFTEAYTYAGIRSKVLGYSDVEGLALIPQLQKYVAGEISAEEALANAQSQGDSILAEAAQQ